MGFTDKFRTQHDEILALAGSITEQLARPQPDAAAIRKQLSNMAGKVGFHLAMEDQALYPRLMERKGSRTEATASKFKNEMGGLAQVFTDYNAKWQLTAMRQDMEGFSHETRKVFGALAHRITRETNELYPLADQAV
jgi:iron-sulfur cluster repair protein YtfE (RIC family)